MVIKNLTKIKDELKRNLELGETFEAISCAKKIGYFGVAAKIAEHAEEYLDAGSAYLKFGNSKKAFESYLKYGTDDKSYNRKWGFEEAKKIAEDQKDAKMILEVDFNEFMTTNSGQDEDSVNKWFWMVNFVDFSKKRYGDYINFEEARNRIEENHCNQLMSSESDQDFREARKIYTKRNEFDNALKATEKESASLQNMYGDAQERIKYYEEEINKEKIRQQEIEKKQIDLKEIGNKLEKEVLKK